MILVSDLHGQPFVLRMYKGEQRTEVVNFTPVLVNRGATITSVAWSSEDSGVSIANESNDDYTASARLSPDQQTASMIECAATLSDGDLIQARVLVRVVDPRSYWAGYDDYCGC